MSQTPFISILASQNDIALSTQPFDHLEFRNPSSFDPSCEHNPSLDTYCKTVKQEVYKQHGAKFRFNNLTQGERQALNELANNSEIIIKPADKGGLIFVMDTKMYITEVRRQLSNDTQYRPFLYDPTSRHNEKIQDVVNRLVIKGSITQKVADYLVFTKPRTPSLYILPKMQKPSRPPLGHMS